MDARDRADVIVRHHGRLTDAEALKEGWQLLREHPMAVATSVRAAQDGRRLRSASPPGSADAAVSVWFEAGQPDAGGWQLRGREGEAVLSVRPLR